VGPRVVQDDTAEEGVAVQSVIQDIDMYPLAEFDGTTKRRDWRTVPKHSEAGWLSRQGRSALGVS
jgi:hypothetical protein